MLIVLLTRAGPVRAELTVKTRDSTLETGKDCGRRKPMLETYKAES